MTGVLVPTRFSGLSGRARRAWTGDAPEPRLELRVLIPARAESVETLTASVGQLDLRPRDDRQADGRHPVPMTVRVAFVVEGGRLPDVEAARRAAAASAADIEVWLVESCTPKARGLNAALARTREPCVAIFDADTRLTRQVLDALAVPLLEGADMSEALDLAPGAHPLTAAANTTAMAFQGSMEWLKGALGRRFLGTNAVALTTDLWRRLGPWPEEGVEEGYRWSMQAAHEPVRHVLVPMVLSGEVPATPRLMLRQRTRWLAGQLHGSLEVLLRRGPEAPGREAHRALATAGLASILAEAALLPLLAVSVVGPRRARRWAGATTLAMLAAEAARLRSGAHSVPARESGLHFSVPGALTLEVVESGAAWIALALVIGGRSGAWRQMRP